MKIVIETIPHEKHRYPTVGDWWRDPDGTLQIRVSEFDHRVFPLEPTKNYALLIALHELIEAALCKHRGIPELEVTAFDMEHPELDDPGLSQDAPYHHEHVFAENIERLVAAQLDVDWQDYDAAVMALDGPPVSL